MHLILLTVTLHGSPSLYELVTSEESVVFNIPTKLNIQLNITSRNLKYLLENAQPTNGCT